MSKKCVKYLCWGLSITFFIWLVASVCSPLYVSAKYGDEWIFASMYIWGIGLVGSILVAGGQWQREDKMKFYIELEDELEKRGKTKEQREKIKKIVMREDEDKKSKCWWDDFDS